MTDSRSELVAEYPESHRSFLCTVILFLFASSRLARRQKKCILLIYPRTFFFHGPDPDSSGPAEPLTSCLKSGPGATGSCVGLSELIGAAASFPGNSGAVRLPRAPEDERGRPLMLISPFTPRHRATAKASQVGIPI
ncbi:hypothetical protein EYF80_062243 [Liparis tanakae]|uniref:Uncharacterized protein n=1 Tax=Liparis tanakae TaxID=230148 RepID=A0A4Z2EG37_9TELE|nr:hypothetical protein EYF80_062243 [Liparis tanakae]